MHLINLGFAFNGITLCLLDVHNYNILNIIICIQDYDIL